MAPRVSKQRQLQIFTETEINTLEKMLNETRDWWKEKSEAQEKLALHDDPAYTLNQAGEKVTKTSVIKKASLRRWALSIVSSST